MLPSQNYNRCHVWNPYDMNRDRYWNLFSHLFLPIKLWGRQILLLLSPIYRRWNWGWERLNNLSVVTWLGNAGAGIWTQVAVIHIEPYATVGVRVDTMCLFVCWASKEKLIKHAWGCKASYGSLLKPLRRLVTMIAHQSGLHVEPAVQGYKEV